MKDSLLIQLILAFRPKQWTKNAVVLAAFFFALGDTRQAVSLDVLWTAFFAALIFCAVSSGIYLLNDIKDRELDREHPQKRFRPIAAGKLPVPAAFIAALVLLGGGLTAAGFIEAALVKVMACYILLQLAYCFLLKEVALVDIFIIAVGFVLRALAGAVAIKVIISPWLLLCTLFLALFLALCKRRHEKVVVGDKDTSPEGTTRPSLRNYNEYLLDQLIGMMGAATCVAYALYTLWPDTQEKFGTYQLVFTVPFVVYGIFRYLDLVYRHQQGGRPEQTLLTDPPLLINIGLYGATVLAVLILN